MKRSLVAWVLLLANLGCGGAPRRPPTEASAESAYDRRAWSECSTAYDVLGGRSVWKRASHYYDAACCDAQGGRPDAAFAHLEQATANGFENADAATKDLDLAALRDDPRWPGFLAAARATHARMEKTLHQDLVLDLRVRARADQDARNAYVAAMRAGSVPPELVDEVKQIDHDNTEALKAMVATYGWPGRSLVGEDGANNAWLLVQHADQDRAFQKQVLALLEPLVARGEVSPHHFAYLYDRVAVAEHRPQRFGTQCDDNGDPGAVEDPPNLDARRAAYGMSTMAEYRKSFLEHR